MTLTGETHILREKPVLVPLCPLQISYGLALYLTCASLVRGWQLTALIHGLALKAKDPVHTSQRTRYH